jgi:hypothetical protein
LRTGLADFAGHGVAAGPKIVAFSDGATPLGIQGQDFVEAIVVFGATYERLAHGIGIGTDLFQREH